MVMMLGFKWDANLMVLHLVCDLPLDLNLHTSWRFLAFQSAPCSALCPSVLILTQAALHYEMIDVTIWA